MKNQLLAMLAAMLLLAGGCAQSVVPEQLMARVDKGLSLEQVRQNPGAYQGAVVLWGGRIARTINKGHSTLIEIVQMPLDGNDRPMRGDVTQGRFLVEMNGFLDPFVYGKGRDLTAVGAVHGTSLMELDQTTYTYVLLKGEEVYLWKPLPHPPGGYYPSMYWGLYGGPWGPYWGPWGGPAGGFWW